MAPLRKKSLKAVWGLFSGVCLAYVAAQIYLFSIGWPRVSLREIGADTLAVTFTLAASLSNLPDFFSIVIYIKMWRHFTTKVDTDNSPGISIDNGEYGGIWVGEIGDEIASHGSHQQELPHDLNMDHNSGEENEHHARTVLKTLHWHLGLALVDMFLPVLGILGCSGVYVRFIYVMQILFYFWVPLLVIKKSFEQLDGMKDYLLQLLRSNTVDARVVH